MLIHLLTQNPVRYLRIVVVVILSVCLHELAHGIAALSQGDDTPRESGHMTMNPVIHMGWESLIFLAIAGIAWGQMPVNPEKFRWPRWSNILVSAAGPLANLALGLAFIALLLVALRVPGLSREFFFLAAQMNLVLCLFNLLPIPPLDGFHILAEFFPRLKGLNNGAIGLFALMLFFLIPGLGSGLFLIANLGINTVVKFALHRL